MIRNLHTFEDSWWDGPERFQWVNRNAISQVQNEDLFKFIKLFAPIQYGLHIGGRYKDGGKRSNWESEKKPYTVLLNLKDICDVYADAAHLPYKDEIFGYIVSFHTFEHIKGNPLDILKEWFRVLVPGGLMSLTMPNKDLFLHNSDVIDDGKAAYHEMAPIEFYNLIQGLNDNIELILFNSRDNNFDFDVIMRKKI